MTTEKQLYVTHGDGIDASIIDGAIFLKNVINWSEPESQGIRLNRSEAVLLYEWLKDALNTQSLWEAEE